MKNNKTMMAAVVCGGLALAGFLTAAAQETRKPKAIMFMLDGLRADALETACAPNIARLRAGTWAPGYRGLSSGVGRTVPDAAPSSAANHTTLATGVTAAKHGVFKNGLTKDGKYAEWPTWLARVAKERGAKSLFVYSWGENKDLGVDPKVRFLGGSDAANGAELPKIMAAPDAPDAVLYFIDIPDHFGHGTGFYPFGYGYLHGVHEADAFVGDVLAAIRSRPTFDQEDWLVTVTGDHGGYNRAHGMWGGHASTVPLVAAGRHLEQGRIPGSPHHYDLTATTLAHFGFDVAQLKLDGKVLGKAAPAAPSRALKEGLAVLLPFSGGFANAVAGGPAAKPFGAAGAVKLAGSGFLDGCLHVAGGTNALGGVRLEGTEKLVFEQGAFAATMWVRLPADQVGDPAIFGNKDWTSGMNPGFVLTAARPTPNFPRKGVAFNCATSDARKRIDAGSFDMTAGAWTFLAVTRSAEGVLMVYQGGADGRFNWIADEAAAASLASGKAICLGQDGTGSYRFNLEGDIDDFALWTRALEPEDVRRIYEAGRKGLGLVDVLAHEGK